MRLTFFGFVLFLVSCQAREQSTGLKNIQDEILMTSNTSFEIATFAGGCFWCTEAVFLELAGVQSVKPGYIGGTIPDPTYEQICTGSTGHAEAIEIVFDPKQISYLELLEVFFATHDPTTLNRQGNDVGTQYRSEIFYHSQKQREEALHYIGQLESAKVFNGTIVTKVSAASTFYVAEDYHQNYYNRNKEQGYCSYVITPKVNKVRKYFPEKLR